MATYEKIDDNNFIEVTEQRRKLTRAALIAKRNQLRAEYDALVQPTNQELVDYAKSVHPYYVDKARLLAEWQDLKDLIEYLQSL